MLYFFISIPCRSYPVHEPRYADRHKRDRCRRGKENAEKRIHLIAVAENKDVIRGNAPGRNKVHGADGDEREKPHDPPSACMQENHLKEVESDRDGGDEELDTHGGCYLFFQWLYLTERHSIAGDLIIGFSELHRDIV